MKLQVITGAEGAATPRSFLAPIIQLVVDQEGIEPSSLLCQSGILPLNYRPRYRQIFLAGLQGIEPCLVGLEAT